MKERRPVLINIREKTAFYSYGTDVNFRKMIRVGPEPQEEYLLARRIYSLGSETLLLLLVFSTDNLCSTKGVLKHAVNFTLK